MLLQALVACAGVTTRSRATNREIDVSGTVRAEGDLDVRGTLGVDPREASVGFRVIRPSFELESPASSEELDALSKVTEHSSVVPQTILTAPAVVVSRG